MQSASLNAKQPVDRHHPSPHTSSSGGAPASYSQSSPAQHPQSAAARGGRLVYADPRSLPSFPSLGVKNDGAAASAAASLGWANQNTFEHWKPGATSPSASAAATLAKNYKMPPAWQPESNSAGSRAAMLAAESAGRRDEVRKSDPVSGWGNSAANLAFKAKATPQTPHMTSMDRQRSLHAAKGAMSGPRPRSKSSPLQPTQSVRPDEANAASSALRAATLAHRPSTRSPAQGSGAVPYTTMGREMFTSHPPVKPEVDEQKRADVIHASAVAMAKKMYTQQQKSIDAAKHAQTDSSGRGAASSEIESRGGQYTNLQEAAYKLAQDRLAKLHEEHQKSRDLQEYYGGSTTTPQRRFTMRSKLRRRSSSDGDVIEDRRKSQQIRQQMSLFNSKISEVDEQKRQRDRDALLAAAQRNVKAQLHGMDEKLYADTGKVAPSLLSEWELKAHTAAQTRSDARKDANAGKIDLGGGKFMDQKAIDEIAAKRVQPVLDEINEKAEKERERQEVLRLEEEAKRKAIEVERARDREIKEIHQKIKSEQKAKDKERKEELKHEEKAAREAEKALKSEQKQHAREEKRRASDAASDPELPATDAKGKKPAIPLFERPAKLQTRPKDDGIVSPEKSPKSPNSDDNTSPTSRVKNWLKSRFTRPRAKSSADTDERSFVGGHALRHPDGTGSMTSLGNGNSSMREVALAGRGKPLEPTPRPSRGLSGFEMGESSTAARGRSLDREASFSRASRISSMSSGSERFTEAKEVLSDKGSFAPPKPIQDPAKKKSQSPIRDSRFLENLE